MKKNTNKAGSRRDALKRGIGAGIAAIAGIGGINVLASQEDSQNQKGEKVKVLTADGKLVEVDKNQLSEAAKEKPANQTEAKKGIKGKKFVMVIDLSRCANARKCVDACQEGHHLPKSQEWMRVYLMQDNKNSAPYWFPRPCFHCDYPQCVNVCPVGATYKREDGIVLVDNERCIGCKFCMTSCPYSARVFNWKHYPEFDNIQQLYSPETGFPGKEGTVGKCVFCADLLRKNELPRCVQACPMGVIFFGDMNEDVVTNGEETVRFSELISKRGGYRYLEELGSSASVYYLPPVDRQFKFEEGLQDISPEVKKSYENTPYFKDKSNKS